MLTWNVYIENINQKKIEIYNIFSYYGLEESFKKIKEECNGNKSEFAEKVDRALVYRFWAKCEWEIILSDWPPSDKFNKEKIDVYDQVRLNWDIFIDYVWDNL